MKWYKILIRSQKNLNLVYLSGFRHKHLPLEGGSHPYTQFSFRSTIPRLEKPLPPHVQMKSCVCDTKQFCGQRDWHKNCSKMPYNSVAKNIFHRCKDLDVFYVTNISLDSPIVSRIVLVLVGIFIELRQASVTRFQVFVIVQLHRYCSFWSLPDCNELV
jgi:hypothetical protein